MPTCLMGQLLAGWPIKWSRARANKKPNHAERSKMKLFKTLVVTLFACALVAGSALAESCCVKAKAKGKDCEHPCCVKAHKDGKLCEKCQPDANNCCDKAIAKGKECTHKCCADAKKDGKVCEKCNPPKKDAKKEEKK